MGVNVCIIIISSSSSSTTGLSKLWLPSMYLVRISWSAMVNPFLVQTGYN